MKSVRVPCDYRADLVFYAEEGFPRLPLDSLASDTLESTTFFWLVLAPHQP